MPEKGGYRATEVSNMRLKGNKVQEQEATGQYMTGTRIYRGKGHEQEATGQQRPGTGGYRATEARNRRLQVMIG